jgi:hypothetical protein
MTIHEIMSNQRAAVMRLRALRENRKPMPIKTKPVIVKIVKQEPNAKELRLQGRSGGRYQ